MQANHEKRENGASRPELLRRKSSPTPPSDNRNRQIGYIEKTLMRMRVNARALKKQASRDAQWASRALTDLSRLVQEGALIALALVVLSSSAHADDRRRQHRRETHNYIIERQQAYQVQGVPTSRLIIGKREIDIYPNGLMFEKNNVVGVRGR